MNVRTCPTKAPQRALQCIGLLLTLAFPLIKSTFNHLWPIFPRVELQAVLCFFPLLELSSWALSDGLSHLSPVHFSPSETLGVRQSGVWGTQLSPTHRSSWTASRSKVCSVLPEEKSLTATAMDYINLFMYCTINLLFMDYRHAAKSHGKRSWFLWVYLCF